MEEVKYAIVFPADQTIVYVAIPEIVDGWWATTEHHEVKLWTSKTEAEIYLIKVNEELGKDWASIEKITDEAEFRTRKDTW